MEIKLPVFFEMDDRAKEIVRKYAKEHLDKTDGEAKFDVFIVWKVKALQNWKWLLSTTLFDGMYYELTYNGDKKEFYLDAYKKFENRTVTVEEIGKNTCCDCEHYSDTFCYCDCEGHGLEKRDAEDDVCEDFKEREEE